MKKKAICYLLIMAILISFTSIFDNNVIAENASYGEPVEFSNIGEYNGIVYTTDFYGSNGGIRFENGNVEVHSLPDGMINEGAIYTFCIYNNRIYYQTGEEASDPTYPGKIYSCNIDGSDNIMLADDVTGWSNIFIVDNYLYYQAYKTVEYYGPANYFGGIYKINLNNMSTEKIISDESAGLAYCDGEYVYYTCRENNKNKYRAMSIDGNINLDVQSDSAEFDYQKVVKGNTVYYFIDNILYSSNRRGNDVKEVCSVQLLEEYSHASVDCVTESKIYYSILSHSKSGNKAYVYCIDRNKNEIKVILNNSEISFDQPPVMINDRVMVPIRAIFEALGYTVEWNQATQTAIATKSIDKIFVQLNSNEINYILKGSSGTYYCDTQPQMISDRILVPVRAIAESAGCEVNWDGNESTVYIINSMGEPKINAIIMNADAKLTSNDAGLVREVLLANKLLPVSESNVHSMFEPDMKTFNRIVDLTISQADENDITFFYYSGHGGSDGHISPTYNRETKDGSFTLSPQKIIDTLEQIPGTIVIVLDSCYSGAINELSGIDTDKFKILTASEASSYSNTSNLTVLPISTAQIGKFTEAFLNGLGGLEGGNIIYNSLTGRDGKAKADYNNDRKVTISELFEYIDKNMNKKYTVDGKTYYQNPTVSDKNDQTVIYAY